MIDRADSWLGRLDAMTPRHEAVIHSPHPPADCARRLRDAFERAGQTSGAGRPIGVISDSGGWAAFFHGKTPGSSRMTLDLAPAETGARLAARTELAPFVKLVALVAILLIAWSAFDFVGDALTALTGGYRRFHPVSRLISLIFLPTMFIAVSLWARRAVADDHDRLAAFVRDTVEGRLEPVSRPLAGRPSQSIVH